ncbi:hypothetical protein [Bacillus sp. S/N-304-OC-R1]|uniref:hypothetical protein n=1 Tax=Bacillus sp. S/N-304-OC-R1 TaxID=2758034 RepID=UPI001C8E2D30|nr:hypothetical protein [Bacillus sp. S/N-304-OC-R1]MBY0122735.1 hypothetical protein [Bacillus sp. S/N-304-OC-R1]
MKISSLAAAIKEDVNQDDSVIINSFGKILNVLFKFTLFLCVPYMAYLLFLFYQQG